MAYSIEEALKHCGPDEECFVIGGGMVYRQFLPLADKLYITRVHATFEADVFFPEINPEEWQEVTIEDPVNPDREMDYTFITYLRKK